MKDGVVTNNVSSPEGCTVQQVHMVSSLANAADRCSHSDIPCRCQGTGKGILHIVPVVVSIESWRTLLDASPDPASVRHALLGPPNQAIRGHFQGRIEISK